MGKVQVRRRCRHNEWVEDPTKTAREYKEWMAAREQESCATCASKPAAKPAAASAPASVNGVRVNRYADTCTECGGEVAPGEGRLWWQAAPDDGGDVAGRTPAGWCVTHLDSAKCQAHRAQIAADKQTEQTTTSERVTAWLQTAPAIRTVDVIDETDGTGNDVPRKIYTLPGVTATFVRRNYPSLPVYYRHAADGQFELLGSYSAQGEVDA